MRARAAVPECSSTTRTERIEPAGTASAAASQLGVTPSMRSGIDPPGITRSYAVRAASLAARPTARAAVNDDDDIRHGPFGGRGFYRAAGRWSCTAASGRLCHDTQRGSTVPPSDPPRAHVQADSPAAGAVDAPRPRLFDALAAQRRTAVAAAIEDAALGLFAARRMDDVTMDEIAAAAGVAVRTVYRYFPTKDQILLAVPLRGGEAMSAAIRSRPTSEAPFEALRNAIEAMAPTVDNAELERWFTALGRNEPNGRLTRMAFLVSTEALTEALAERAGLTPQDLWPAMAGTMAANALLVGQHQWSMHGGDLATHQLAALQIAGDGLAAFDPGRTGRTS